MQEHEQWLTIAKEDLKAVKVLIKAELFSSVTYHCQQSPEKALKAYLCSKKQAITKTHDLIKLLEVCLNFDTNFKKIYDPIKCINPFSTKFRYPSEYDIPDQKEAKQAIKRTEKILTFIVNKLSKSNSQQENIFS